MSNDGIKSKPKFNVLIELNSFEYFAGFDVMNNGTKDINFFY